MAALSPFTPTSLLPPPPSPGHHHTAVCVCESRIYVLWLIPAPSFIQFPLLLSPLTPVSLSMYLYFSFCFVGQFSLYYRPLKSHHVIKWEFYWHRKLEVIPSPHSSTHVLEEKTDTYWIYPPIFNIHTLDKFVSLLLWMMTMW